MKENSPKSSDRAISDKEKPLFQNMVKVCLENKLFSEKEGKDLLSKINDGKFLFFEALDKILTLLDNRLTALKKLKEDTTLTKEAQSNILFQEKAIDNLLEKFTKTANKLKG